MKYIITESKLESIIIDFLNETFDVSDINWTNPYDVIDDETGEEGDDENRILFYIGDYNLNEDGCFMWYGCGYFDEGSKATELCPIVQLEHPYDIQLNGYFGDMWHEPFKKWFKHNFELSVKTIE